MSRSIGPVDRIASRLLAVSVAVSGAPAPRRGQGRSAATARGVEGHRHRPGRLMASRISGFWTNATYMPLRAAAGRDQGVLHARRGARRADQGSRGRPGSASRPSRAPPPTSTTTSASSGSIGASRHSPEPAHVAGHRSAGRQDSAGDGGGAEAGRRAGGGAESAGRPATTPRRTCRSTSAASSWAAPGRR